MFACDRDGNFTCFSNDSVSLADYMIASAISFLKLEMSESWIEMIRIRPPCHVS